jgi:hypothetical protein
MKPIRQRTKKLPKTEDFIWVAKYEPLKPHHLRKQELSRIHGIPENDIFVDPVNGVELYKTPTGWAYRPESWKGVSE